ncbi:Baseplate protein J-like domain-containing protein [Kosakonia sp. BK9b]
MSKENALFPVVKTDIDFATLWAQATGSLSALCGDIWTDTTEHDPGVTLLQAATWNDSDLGYRLSLSLNDLLTDAGKTTLFPPEFGPQGVLCCNTVTAEDYRRAILDIHSSDIGISGVDQGFIFDDCALVKEPEDSSNTFRWWYDKVNRNYTFTKPTDSVDNEWQELTLRGNNWLYLVPSRYTQNLSSEDNAMVQTYLADFLASHRNLGEFFARVIWLQPVDFNLNLEISLSSDVENMAAVVASIFETTSAQLIGSVARFTTAQMHEKGYTDEEIFEGPFLKHGWQIVEPTPLSVNGMTISLGALANRLLAIAGVESVNAVSLASPPQQIHSVASDKWSWQIDAGYYPRLWGADPFTLLASTDSPLTLVIKGGIYEKPDAAAISQYLSHPALINTPPVVLPAGTLRDFNTYVPVGNRLPSCYQLQTPLEQVEQNIRELHQFLLPVDQLLANMCAEIALIPQLLAFEDRADVIRGTRWPYDDGTVNDDVHSAYAYALKQLFQRDAAIFQDDKVTPHPLNFSRELAFLQYLLGYFGASRAARPLTLDLADFLLTQRAYLAQQPQLGYDRINIQINKVSALQKRITAIIGLNSECFKDNPDLSNLPFYLIEHRQLLPLVPATGYAADQTPQNVTISGTQVSITQSGIAGKIEVGQLVDIIAIEGDSRLVVGQQMVTSVSGDTFTVNATNSQQLTNDLSRLQTAWSGGNLRWQSSNLWLQDMDFRLNYANAALQPASSTQKLLSSNDQSPFPAMVSVGDKIVIRGASLSTSAASEVASVSIEAADADADDWLINATILEVNPLAGTLLVEKAADSQYDFPAEADAWRYVWNFSESAYATTDRFSFVISLVLNRAIIASQNIVPDKLISWLLQVVMEQFPAHVSLINHWLSDSAFKNFAQTYARWQNNGNPLGDDAWSILQMLTLGHLPVTELGIGLMRVATDAQQTAVIGADGSQWNTSIIVQEQLFYVPQELPTA